MLIKIQTIIEVEFSNKMQNWRDCKEKRNFQSLNLNTNKDMISMRLEKRNK